MAADATEGKWQNFGDDLFKERLGEESFNEKKKTQFQLPETSDQKGAEVLSKMKLAFKSGDNLYEQRAQVAAKEPGGGSMHQTGGFGFAEMLGCPEFEGSGFFRKGRMFKVNVCHGNLLNADDASSDVRLAFLKLRDPEVEEVLDLPMTTGRTSMFFNLTTYSKFVEKIKAGKLEHWTLQQPANLVSLIGAMRRAPESYGMLTYYCHTTYQVKVGDDVKLVRFRYYPMEEEEDESLIDYEEQKSPWKTQRADDSRKATNYLRRQYKQDVIQNEVHYLLQAQVNKEKEDGECDLYNTGIEWDVPWNSLAKISITTPLTDVAASEISFDVNTCPEFISLPCPTSGDDFKSSATVWDQYCDGTICYNRKNPPMREDEVAYVIILQMGDAEFAGTNADVFLTLYGARGKTSPKKLGRPLIDDFKRGALETYHFLAENVGVPLAVQLNLEKKWYNPLKFISDMKVDYLMVLNTRQQRAVFFPYFNWITNERIIPKCEACTPNSKQSFEFVSQLRRYEVWRRRDLFKWKKTQNLHGGIDVEDHSKLPRNLQMEPKSIGSALFRSTFQMPSLIKSLGSPDLNSLGAYLTFAQESNPTLADKYSHLFNKMFNDEAFGRGFLVGSDPTVIERCNAVPENFALTAEMVSDSLKRDVSLEEELKSGNVYIVNYKHFAGISGFEKKGTKRYMASPMVLLYVNPEEELVPLAIQLHQEPSDSNPIWTPKDNRTDWLFAKMWVRNAAIQHHLLYTLLARTLFPLEAVALSLERNLYLAHPVYQLLSPCLKNTIAMSVIEKKNILKEDGLADRTLSVGSKGALEYMKRCYKTYSVQTWIPEKDLQVRAVQDEKELPNYHWRRDSLKAWETVNNWVDDFLNGFYKSDDAVADDTEIQAWVKDIYENGFLKWEEDEVHGVPEEFKSLESLVEFVTMVMYTATFGYASLNYPREYDAFIPISPAAMTVPPPTTKGKTTMESIAGALPKQNAATEWVAYLLSRTKMEVDQPRVTDHEDYFYANENENVEFEKLAKSYKKLDAAIDKKNKKLERPYLCFLPENVPLSPYYL